MAEHRIPGRAIAYAAGTGKRDGAKACDSQYWPAGGRDSTNRADTVRWAKRVRVSRETGDYAALDFLPHADLSGEWADTLTGPALVSDALDAAGLKHSDDCAGSCERCEAEADLFTELCDSYETAFDDAADAYLVNWIDSILA